MSLLGNVRYAAPVETGSSLTSGSLSGFLQCQFTLQRRVPLAGILWEWDGLEYRLAFLLSIIAQSDKRCFIPA